MTEVLVLNTYWEPNYWEKDRIAPYPQRSIDSIRHLKDRTPLPAIGVYIKGKGKDYTSRSPCFLIIKHISENEKGEPQFDIQFISHIQGITSAIFIKETPRMDLFYTITEEKTRIILEKLGLTSPQEWQSLIAKKATPKSSWFDWIGKYFQEIKLTISNNDYEDKVAEIFTALGFEVEQLGHKQEGEYPDGIIYSNDFAIIYDCKNRNKYFLNAEDKRAITKYVQRGKRRIKEDRNIDDVFFAIVAHSYDKVENLNEIEKETQSKGFLLTSESMLYLLYEKNILGPKFYLSDFDRLLTNKAIGLEDVDKVYKGMKNASF